MPPVPADPDPSHTALTVLRRPPGGGLRPLPPDVHEAAARPALPPLIRPGDLIVATFTARPAAPHRLTANWITDPYRADPAPWDPHCRCAECSNVRIFDSPPPPAGRTVMTRREWGGMCDVWNTEWSRKSRARMTRRHITSRTRSTRPPERTPAGRAGSVRRGIPPARKPEQGPGSAKGVHR